MAGKNHLLKFPLQRPGGKDKKVQKKLRMFNKPICVLTGKEMLLQDSLKRRIFDRSTCLPIGFYSGAAREQNT